MKYLAQTAMWVSMLFSCVRSMKFLRRITAAPGTTSGTEHDKAVSALMFWVIYALLVVFEEYLEWVVRWFPGFYYAKTLFVVMISVPALRITDLVFNDGVVVLFNAMNDLRLRLDGAFNDGRLILLHSLGAIRTWACTLPPLRTVVAQAPFVVLAVLFPNLCECHDIGATSSSGSSSLPTPSSSSLSSASTSSSPSPALAARQAQPSRDAGDASLPPQLRRRFVPGVVVQPPPASVSVLMVDVAPSPTASEPASPPPKMGPSSPAAAAATSPLRIETQRRLAALAPYLRLGASSDVIDGCSMSSKVVPPADPSSDGNCGVSASEFSPQRLLKTALSPLKYGIVKSLLDFDLGHKPTNATSRERRRTTLLAAFGSRGGVQGRGSGGSPGVGEAATITEMMDR